MSISDYCAAIINAKLVALCLKPNFCGCFFKKLFKFLLKTLFALSARSTCLYMPFVFANLHVRENKISLIITLRNGRDDKFANIVNIWPTAMLLTGLLFFLFLFVWWCFYMERNSL